MNDTVINNTLLLTINYLTHTGSTGAGMNTLSILQQKNMRLGVVLFIILLLLVLALTVLLLTVASVSGQAATEPVIELARASVNWG